MALPNNRVRVEADLTVFFSLGWNFECSSCIAAYVLALNTQRRDFIYRISIKFLQNMECHNAEL